MDSERGQGRAALDGDWRLDHQLLPTQTGNLAATASAGGKSHHQSASLSQCLERELNACREVLRAPDFYEGIRAAIIDKDRTPRWSPVHVNAVTQDMLEPFFRPEHVKQMI